MQYKQIIIILLALQISFQIAIPFHNGIFSAAGEYTVSIQLGSPPQTFQVQVDTGSFKLAVPCSGCSNCEGMLNPLFDSSRSSSFSSLPCERSFAYCDDCGIKAIGPNSCLLNSVYQDNSSITGQMVQDLFTVPGMTQPISTPFGCISSMNKEMVAEGVDGIWGVGRSDTNKDGVAQRMDQLITGISAQVGSSSRVLAFCLAVSGGVMNIGTVDNSLHTQPGVTVNYDGPGTDSVSHSLNSITLGQFPIAAAGSLPGIIIDSGTTTSIFTTATFTVVASALDFYCGQLGENCKKSNSSTTNCYQFPDIPSAFSQIPPISINFAGNVVNWYAQQFLAIHNTDTNEYCLTFSGNDGGSYMFGDDFMLNKDIVFGESEITIYPMSKCSGSAPTYAYQATRRLTSQIEENHQQ